MKKIDMSAFIDKCPYCGKPGELYLEESIGGIDGYYRVGCVNTGCKIRPTTRPVKKHMNYRVDPSLIGEILDEWNKRGE